MFIGLMSTCVSCCELQVDVPLITISCHRPLSHANPVWEGHYTNFLLLTLRCKSSVFSYEKGFITSVVFLIPYLVYSHSSLYVFIILLHIIPSLHSRHSINVPWTNEWMNTFALCWWLWALPYHSRVCSRQWAWLHGSSYMEEMGNPVSDLALQIWGRIRRPALHKDWGRNWTRQAKTKQELLWAWSLAESCHWLLVTFRQKAQPGSHRSIIIHRQSHSQVQSGDTLIPPVHRSPGCLLVAHLPRASQPLIRLTSAAQGLPGPFHWESSVMLKVMGCTLSTRIPISRNFISDLTGLYPVILALGEMWLHVPHQWEMSTICLFFPSFLWKSKINVIVFLILRDMFEC
jgi:hypothetical protein